MGVRLGILVTVVVVLVAACGGDDDEPSASPGDEVSGFTEGDFDDIPRLPDSETVDEPTATNGAVAASYLVRGGITVRTVVDDLRMRLEADGWTLIEGPTPVGQAVRADFAQERERLEVSAFPAQAFDEDYENAVQYSLVLNEGLDDPADAAAPTSTRP